MKDIRAVIDASAAPRDLLVRPVLGVPLVLWSFAALRRVLPPDDVAIISNDAEILGISAVRGLHALGPRVRENALMVDPLQPFLTAEHLKEALERGAADCAVFHRSAIEQIRVDTLEQFGMSCAVARGLPPDDPHIEGVISMRLPFSRRIDALVSDVDGVLTDGGIAYAEQEEAGRTFHTHDGMGVKRLHESGIKVAWLSATSNGASIERRARQLGVDLVDAGSGDKGPRFEAICAKLQVDAAAILCLGDDVNDLPAIARAGLSACPGDARPEVRSRVDLILETAGGRGAFREAAELVIDSRHLV